MSKTFKKKINKELFKLIRNKVKCLGDSDSQQRAFISCLGACVISECLNEKGIKINLEDGLCSSFGMLHDFEIADIRTENNIKIDIRAVFDDKYAQMCIPKEHFNQGISPDLYIGVKINKKLDEAEIIGFIKTDDITKTKGNENYFIIDVEELSPVSEINKAITSIEKKEKSFLVSDHEKASSLFIPFIDKTISEDDKNYLLKHISDCDECRIEFSKICGLDNILKNEKENLLIDNDYTLRLFAGDPVFEGEEAEINIADDEEEDLISETVKEQAEVIEDNEKIDNNEKKHRNPRDWADEFIEDEEEPPLVQQPEDSEGLKEEDEDLVFEAAKAEIEIIKDDEEPPLAQQPEDSEGLKDHEDLVFEAAKAEIEIIKDDEEPPLAQQLENFEGLKEGDEEKLTEKELGTPDILNEENVFNVKEKEEAFTENSNKNPGDDVDNIFDSLNDVEIIQGEDDINNILSFFDSDHEHEQQNKDLSEKPKKTAPQQEEMKVEQVPKNVEMVNEPQKLKVDSELLYSENKEDDLIKESIEDHDLDILLHEEGHSKDIERLNSSVEMIRQEDLMYIFGADSNDTGEKESKIDIKELFKKIIKDKNMMAFTIGITLTTTVMFVYLGQINQQVKIAHNNSIETPNKQVHHNKLSGQQKEKKLVEKKIRVPQKSYTREIEKIIKYKKKIKVPNTVEVNKVTEKPDSIKTFNSDSGSKTKQKAEIIEFYVKNISWELSPEIARNSAIKEYFLEAGQVIEKKLNSNFYDLSKLGLERAMVNVDIELNNKGTILNNKIVLSSGSKNFDSFCKKALYEALKNTKFPKAALNSDKIQLKLIINF